MTLERRDLHTLAAVAERAASVASELIARTRPAEIEHKAGASAASQVVTNVDREAEQSILEILEPTVASHGLGILSEERGDDGSRLRTEYFWCVDPLDGTLPFTEGRPGYAVSIALVANEGTPMIGVVADPISGTMYSASSPILSRTIFSSPVVISGTVRPRSGALA